MFLEIWTTLGLYGVKTLSIKYEFLIIDLKTSLKSPKLEQQPWVELGLTTQSKSWHFMDASFTTSFVTIEVRIKVKFQSCFFLLSNKFIIDYRGLL